VNNYTPNNRRSLSIHFFGLNSSGKFSCSSALRDGLEYEDGFKAEMIENWVAKAKVDIKAAAFETALKELNKVLKICQNHLNALYLRSNCFMSLGKHKMAIPDLLSIVQENAGFDKHVYIALAVCFVEVDDVNTAIRQLSKCIEIFPNFSEGYINRGILYNRQQRWDKALNDFKQGIQINKKKGTPYIGLADTLLGMGDTKYALALLEKAFNDPKSYPAALLKRGKIFFEQQHFASALKDLDQVLQSQSENVEAFYYRAFALLGLNRISDAALSLEQVIKYDTSKNYVGAAIYNLGAIKIKQRDYYGAMYTFKRGVDMGLEIEEQKVLKHYVEAILCLMKRNFKEGLNILTKIIKSKNPLIQEYIGNCYAFRGYAHAALENHEKAVQDLTTASGLQVLDGSSEFNLLISKAVLLSLRESENSLKLLSSASKIFPNSIEPKVYTAAINFSLCQSMKKPELAEISKELLDECIKVRESESDLFFFRGVVNYFLGMIKEAIEDIETAIDKAEDNQPEHFFARGACSARLKMYKEAKQDFAIALQLNEKFADAFLFKGRCHFIMDEIDQAFEDFQKLTVMKPDDPEVHILGGNLLLLTGSTEKAMQAYSNATNARPTVEGFIHKAKTFLILENLPEALQELKTCFKYFPLPSVSFDIEVLEILLKAHSKDNLKQSLLKSLNHLNTILSYKHEGSICKNLQIHWFKAVFLFFLGDFQKSKTEFKSSILLNDDSDDETIDRETLEIGYNTALIYILGDYHEAAYNRLNEIVYYLEGKDRGKVLLIMSVLQLGLNQKSTSKNLIQEASKFDPEIVKIFQERKSDIKVLPLSSASKYASVFPMAKVKIADCQALLLRPSFNLPKGDMPKMDFGVESQVLARFHVKHVKCRPETPWLNRVKGTIQFTDEIQNIETESVADSNDEEALIERSAEFNSYSTMRKYKSESISLHEQEVSNNSDSDTSESSNYDDFVFA
jgi:tetratricopeptide (TPR) repeat protein